MRAGGCRRPSRPENPPKERQRGGEDPPLSSTQKIAEMRSLPCRRFAAWNSRRGLCSVPHFAFAKNETAEDCTFSSKELLLRYPRGKLVGAIAVYDVAVLQGAYTTARSVQRDRIFEFAAHIERLQESTLLMLESDLEDAQCAQSRSYLERLQQIARQFDILKPKVRGISRLSMKIASITSENRRSFVLCRQQ